MAGCISLRSGIDFGPINAHETREVVELPDDDDEDILNDFIQDDVAIKTENRIENLWKRGRVGNRRYFPDFGKFMAINEMKAFCSAAPYCWAEEEFW